MGTIEIIENYVDEDFESEVLKLIPKNMYKNRTVFRYGSKIPYGSDLKSEIIPEVFKKIKNIEFDSVTINQYLKNQMIDWHIDKPEGGESIYIISLISSGVLNFKKGKEKKDFLLPRFSLAKMSGELRYEWQHSFIAENHRVSVVLRNTKINP